MRVLFVLDPLEQLQLETETSLLLAAEFQRRGHETWYSLEEDFTVTDQGVYTTAHKLNVLPTGAPQAGEVQVEDASEFSLILMRQDPPVDAAYRFVAQALTSVGERAVVVNKPESVLAWNEKLLPLHFPDLCPPTLVSRHVEALEEFVRAQGTAVVKPISECSGRGIHVVTAETAPPVIRATLQRYPGDPVIVQRYLPEVLSGDKRLFLVGGECIGAVNRVPAAPDKLANIHQGARVEATALNARDRYVVERVGPFLRQHGLWLAGLDVIGGFLTEVNVTSPSALRQINAVTGKRHEPRVVDFLERLVTQRCP